MLCDRRAGLVPTVGHHGARAAHYRQRSAQHMKQDDQSTTTAPREPNQRAATETRATPKGTTSGGTSPASSSRC